MHFYYEAKRLLWFHLANLMISIPVTLVLPLSISGFNMAYPLFSLKVIALLYFNEFPLKKDPFSVAFFAIACVEIALMFLMGSFSFFTFLF